MSVTHVHKDLEGLTMTITAEFDAPVERVWQVWADPRQLELWWGPPGFPATVVDHDLAPGGRVNYFMTGPDGTRYHGWWHVGEVATPNRLELTDGFSDATGAPDDTMPTMTTVVTLANRDTGGTVMVIETRFPSIEAMTQLESMGMEQGMVMALGQIRAILSGDTAPAR